MLACFKCGMQGHIARECPTPAGRMPMTRPGAMVGREGGKGGGGLVIFTCSETGRVLSHCFTL